MAYKRIFNFGMAKVAPGGQSSPTLRNVISSYAQDHYLTN